MESTSKRRPASKPKHHPFLNPKEVLIVLMGFIDMTEARKKIHLAECIDSLRQVGFDSWEDSRKESRRDREVLDNEKQ
ncbi:hypothetical protein CUMW_090380 [Citrus unshiu]|nr:hypothetical protein CUMW_090380 [Citrus unshiu]